MSKANIIGLIGIIVVITGISTYFISTATVKSSDLFTNQEKQELRIANLEEKINAIDSIIDYIESFRVEAIGKDIKVGISSELNGSNAVLFKDSDFDYLRQYTNYRIVNCEDQFNISITIKISKIIDRGGDKSEANLFISKEAADKLMISRRTVTDLKLIYL